MNRRLHKPYVESLSDTRTPRPDFFNRLLHGLRHHSVVKLVRHTETEELSRLTFKVIQRRHDRRPLKLPQFDRPEILVIGQSSAISVLTAIPHASQKQLISVTPRSCQIKDLLLVRSLPRFSGIFSIERIEPMKT